MKCKEWETEVQILEEQELISNDERTRQELNKAHAECISWLAMQESMLKQKAQQKWFEAGDYNSKYFHSMIRDRMRRMQLNKIKNIEATGFKEMKRSPKQPSDTSRNSSTLGQPRKIGRSWSAFQL